eukprot:scaffold21463_cov52-Attheya_sp.AAC.3
MAGRNRLVPTSEEGRGDSQLDLFDMIGLHYRGPKQDGSTEFMGSIRDFLWMFLDQVVCSYLVWIESNRRFHYQKHHNKQ